MTLKSILKNLKQEGYVIKSIDNYLLSLNAKDNDRAINVNSPSQASSCMRANFYSRMGYQVDGTIDPRTRRIFNNGDGVHERLQNYLEKSGMLLMPEVPIIEDTHTIQGHTDGYLALAKDKNGGTLEVGILEIKSINSNGFNNLKEPKAEHKIQAMVYLYASEQRRKYLKHKYPTYEEFTSSKSIKERTKYYKDHYKHFKDGSKYTREEKIQMQVDLGMSADNILWGLVRPITKVVFLYENKDNQELKEYVVTRDEGIIKDILDKFTETDRCCRENEIPEREGTCKSCATCRYCNYKIECWV